MAAEVVELFIPISMFAGLTIVLCLFVWFRYRNRQDMQETIRMALDKGHELSPELIDRMGNPKAPKDKDLRLGIIWLAIAAALALTAVAIPDPSGHALRGTLTGAAFPVCIGIAYLIMWKFTERD